MALNYNSNCPCSGTHLQLSNNIFCQLLGFHMSAFMFRCLPLTERCARVYVCVHLIGTDVPGFLSIHPSLSVCLSHGLYVYLSFYLAASLYPYRFCLDRLFFCTKLISRCFLRTITFHNSVKCIYSESFDIIISRSPPEHSSLNITKHVVIPTAVSFC